MKTIKPLTLEKLAVVCLLGVLMGTLAKAQIFVSNLSSSGYSVSEYNFDGSVINSNLISGSGESYGMAIAGSDIFLTNASAGTIGEYTTSGQVVNADLISGLNLPQGVAISGDDIFVTNAETGVVGEYTTSGQTVNADLITGFQQPSGVAVSGNQIFIAQQGSGGNGRVSEYTTDGGYVSAGLIFTGGNPALDIGISGNDLFVTVAGAQPHIAEYTTLGATINANLVGLQGGVQGFAVTGNTIYSTQGDFTPTIGQYTTTGSTVNSSLITTSGKIQEYVAVSNPTTGAPALNPTTVTSSVSAGQSYASVTPITSNGGLGTTTSIIDGTASSAKTVTLSTTNLATEFTSLASDAVSVTGIDASPDPSNIFTLQLTFDLNAANQIGGADAARLLWFNPVTGKWENAVLGDSDGGASAQFIFGAYNPATDFHLGYYGVDTATDTVWAVIDHNSTYATGDLDIPPQLVPEPSTWGMLIVGGSLLFLVMRRRRLQHT